MPKQAAPPLPHHYELVAYKNHRPDATPHRVTWGMDFGLVYDQMLRPYAYKVDHTPVMAAQALLEAGYVAWEIRPVYLSAREWEAIWSQKPALQITHPVKDYD